MDDFFMLSLCLWREARGEPVQGIIAVANVIKNRVLKNNSSYYEEITKPWQFSSITATGDRQLNLWPKLTDPSFTSCFRIADQIIKHLIPDNTKGSTLYYSDTMSLPIHWNRALITFMLQIGHHRFYTENPPPLTPKYTI